MTRVACAISPIVVTALVATAGGVSAQPADPTPAASTRGSQSSSVLLERIESGPAIAPEFRVTEVDDRTARLAGVYGGWVTDHTVLVGAGGYWLTHASKTFKFWYGGAVVEWLVLSDRPIGFSVRGLVGLGEARLSDPLSAIFVEERDDGRVWVWRLGPRFGRRVAGRLVESQAGEMRVVFDEGFFVAEPQVNLLVRVTRWLRFNVGASYRAVGGAGGVNERLRGPAGSVAVQIGG
jgi:hypothetical protein